MWNKITIWLFNSLLVEYIDNTCVASEERKSVNWLYK